MLKEVLAQYCDLQEEIKGIRNRIDTLEKNIKQLGEETPIVTDTVIGTRKDGTIGSIKISGYPVVEHLNREHLLKKHSRMLSVKEDELLELSLQVEEFIEQQEDSRIRAILRYKFLDGLTWTQVSHRMGGKHTADSCRMTINNFFKSP